MRAFINGISAVSPQKTFTGEFPGSEAVNYCGVNYLKCIDPPVGDFIDPMVSRRMSRLIKYGVCAALKCIADTGNPDGIICGTGLGCIEDTEKFLRSIYTNEEKLLNPTPFIQSTHNTVSSTIAILLKCNGYNCTYVHRGNSFESALSDGIMLLDSGLAGNLLIGGLDEITPDSFNITQRLGLWKREPFNSLDLHGNRNKGTLAGEGVAFFSLGKTRTAATIASVNLPAILYKPGNYEEVFDRLQGYLEENSGSLNGIDLLLLGLNGDPKYDEVYYNLKDKVPGDIPCAYYKHLCGEYDTSASFALYLAAEIIRKQSVPGIIRLDEKPAGPIKNILIYNHLRNVNHSMILISSC